MKTLNLVQGSPAWLAHRAQHFNASDAPAMLGISSNKSRSALLRELHSGVAREFSDYVQEHVIDPGHAYEAKARAIAEQLIGEELFPCVGVSDDGLFSASFDGLTLLGELAWEHKRLNEELRAAMTEGCTGSDLPEMYQVQMEHQCLVSGATSVLFMASQWDGDELVEERHCVYVPDAQRRARVLSGWGLLQADLDAYEPGPESRPTPIGRAPDQLPALRIELTGMVTESNLEDFKASAIAVFRGISTDLQTDQDFADAEKTVKWCGDIEDQLKAAKNHALSQTQSIDALFKAIDAISAEARAKRLDLEKRVKSRKEQIRGEIFERGRLEVIQHYQTINATLGQHAITVPGSLVAELGASIKGLRTITTLNDAVDTVVTGAKIAASQQAERVRANIALLDQQATGHAELFPDRVTLCATKSPEDLQNLIAARVAEKEAQLERERERIRQEELAKASTPAAAEKPCDSNTGETTTIRPGANERADVSPAAAGSTQATIKLGDFNQLIAPLSISAEGLAKFGFQPLAQPRNAKVYRIVDLAKACTTLINILASAPQRALEQATQKEAA